MYTSERQIHAFRKNYLNAVLHQNIAWYDKQGAGAVASRITADIEHIKTGLGEKIGEVTKNLSTFAVAMILAFSQNWKLTLALFSIVPVIGITITLVNIVGGKYQINVLNHYVKSSAYAEEALSAIRTVMAFGAQKKMSDRYNSNLGNARSEAIKKALIVALGLGVVYFLLFSGYAIAFYFGAILLEIGEITAGEIISIFFSVLIGAFCLGQIAPDVQAFMNATASGQKIFEVIDRAPEIDSSSTDGIIIPEEKMKGRIVIEDVDFSYPTRIKVRTLKQMNLTIESNTTVALVGESGSGKSTIIQLLERFYNPIYGTITLDGYDITTLNVKWLRRKIGLVGQEPVLFEGTVAENVAHGLIGSEFEKETDEQKRERIIEACKTANAHEFIIRMADGYDTPVGERGMLLSGGQKQRICIARAIIKDPKILLLDEATSALDTTSERIVQAALDKASSNRTTIVIAHRLSTIRNADNIVVMVKGKITETGTHDSLLEIEGGLYKKLVEAQSVQKNEKEETEKMALEHADSSVTVSPEIMEPKESIKLAKAATSKESGVMIMTPEDALESGSKTYYSNTKVFTEMMKMNAPEWKYLSVALFASVINGMVYPIYAIAFGGILQVFSTTGPEMRERANFYALMFFIIAIVNFFSGFFSVSFLHNYQI